MGIETTVRGFKNSFNKYRTLVELGKKLMLFIHFLPESERKEIEERYKDQDIEYIKQTIKRYCG